MEQLTLLAIVLLVGSVIANIIVNLASEEVYAWLPRLAKWFLGRALARLRKPEHRTLYEEQFHADLADVPGNLAKVWYALRIFLGSGKLARELEGEETREIDYAVLRQASFYSVCSSFLWIIGEMVVAAGRGNNKIELLATFLLYLATMAMLYVLYLRTKLYKQPGAS